MDKKEPAALSTFSKEWFEAQDDLINKKDREPIKLTDLANQWNKSEGELVGMSVAGMIRAYFWYEGDVAQSHDIKDIQSDIPFQQYQGWVCLKWAAFREDSLNSFKAGRSVGVTDFYIEPMLFPFHPVKRNKSDGSPTYLDFEIDLNALFFKLDEVERLVQRFPELTRKKTEQLDDVKIDREVKDQKSVNKNDISAQTITDSDLNIIRCLVNIVEGSRIDKEPLTYRSQAAVITAILESYPHMPGVKERTLEDRFALANSLITSRASGKENRQIIANRKIDLCIIGGLLKLLLGKGFNQNLLPFNNRPDTIATLLIILRDMEGLEKATLEDRFAEAGLNSPAHLLTTVDNLS